MKSLKNNPSVIEHFHSKAKLKGQIPILNCIKHFILYWKKWMNEFLHQIPVQVCAKGTWHIMEVAVIDTSLQIIQKSASILLSSIIY